MSKINFILDLDYIWQDVKKPNIIAAKLFSYLEQKEESVYFLRSVEEAREQHDKLYIFQEEKYYKNVPINILRDEKTISYSKLIKEIPTTKINDIVLVCRPNYEIYKNTSARGYELKLLFYEGNKIKKQQSGSRYKKAGTLVCDKDISSFSKEDLLYLFGTLSNEDDIAFLYPLYIDVFLDKEVLESFLSLDIKNDKNFRLVFKVHEENYENYLEYFEVFKKIKQRYKIRVKILDIKIISTFHWKDASEAEKEFIRNIKLSSAAKKLGIKIKFIYPKNIVITPFWGYFLPQQRMKNKGCYLEYALKPFCKTRNLKYWEIINNPLEWNNREIESYINSLVRYPEIVFNHGAITTTGITEGLYKIDMDKLYENARRRKLL